MLDFLRRERRQDQNRQKAESKSIRLRQSQEEPQGDAQTPLEPVFPEPQEAQEIHDQALLDHGQPQAHLINPGGLDGALGRAANYWYYGQGSPAEKMADAAAALAHGVGAAQAFEDGNKRTAYHTARYFLHNNGYGYLSPVDYDDEELADHLIGHGEGTHSLEDTQALLRSRIQPNERTSNILDQIHDDLDPRVWDDPASPEPKLRKEHREFIYEKIWTTLEAHGYDGMEKWLSLVFTGSLTTYQYSDESDVDISLFVDTLHFPDWSRAEMIGIMVDDCDGTTLPGTPFPLQCFVVPPGITREDLYKPGMRSGYELATDTWIMPPDKSRVHDVEHEMNEAYTIALENADKMERLLRYEPDKAIQFWHQIHKRRQRDMKAGRGDYAPSNITYKMLANRGLFPQISDASGEYIASMKKTGEDYQGWTNWHTWNTKLMMDNERELYDRARELAAQGATPEQIRDWALPTIIAPHNRNAITDAQEWNEIPEHERLDHHYEELKDKNEQAADLVNQLGFGPDVSDAEPTLIDPELVNWHEIHQSLNDEINENRKWEEETAANQAKGYGYGAASGQPEHTLQMLNAWMKYHGAPPSENESLPSGFPAVRHMTDAPYAEFDPSQLENNWGAEEAAKFRQQGYIPVNTNEHGFGVAADIANGRATPAAMQKMQEALTAEGYTPEQIAEITKQRYRWTPEGRIDLFPKEIKPDLSLDEPSEFTLPPNWTASTDD